MKKKNTPFPIKEVLLFGVVVLFLILISLIARQFSPFIREFLDIGPLGMLLYFFIAVLSVVMAPANMLFLIPIATILWGPALTSILSIAGWTLGAQIAFEIARKGKHILQKFVSLEKIQTLEEKMPHKSLFISIIALRVIIPVDILSYAIAFFTTIKRVPYFFSSLIGTTPFAVIFAYLGAVPLKYQIILIIIGIILLIISWRLLKNNR